MRKFLIKLLNRDILKTHLWSLLDYLLLLILLIVVLVLGIAPAFLFGYFVKDMQNSIARVILVFASVVFTALSFSIVCNNTKINSIYSETIKQLEQSYHHICEQKHFKYLLKKSDSKELNALEYFSLRSNLNKLGIDISELGYIKTEYIDIDTDITLSSQQQPGKAE